MKEFRKRLWTEVALCASFLPLIHSTIAYTLETPEHFLAADTQNVNVDKDTYTINFNNIAIIEFIRFASKITNLNFIFDQNDLQFNVSVVSEEAVTAKNVMSVLAQVLRIHELMIVEQEGNVLITKNHSVNAIPPIYSSDISESPAQNAALITRVFRIKNANVNSIANILRRMISAAAQIEISAETRQLIVTDLATSIDQIASLLASLDTPHTPLEVESYRVKNISPAELIALTQQILNPFTEGNALIFVPQVDRNSIFIVSTPYLIERAMTVMEDLDAPANKFVVGNLPGGEKNVFLYQAVHRSPAELISALKIVDQELKSGSGPQIPLEIAIASVKEVGDGSSLMFLANPDTTTKLKAILDSLDVPTGSFFIYRVLNAPKSQIISSFQQISNGLQTSSAIDQNLVDAIKSMKWIMDDHYIIFTGTPTAIKQLQDLLTAFDTSSAATFERSTFFIYTATNIPTDQIASSLRELAFNLKAEELQDPFFLEMIARMREMPNLNALIFTGNASSIDRMKEILHTLDITPSINKLSRLFVYRPEHASAEQLQSALNSLIPVLQQTNTISDQHLISAIQDLKWNASTQSFTVSSEPDTIDRLKEVILSFDTSLQPTGGLASGFFLYKLQTGKCSDILEQLKGIADKLPPSSLKNQNLVNAINAIECVESNNSLLITGSTDAIEQVKELIAEFDLSSGHGGKGKNYFLYKLQAGTCETVLGNLKHLVSKLPASNPKNQELINAVDAIDCLKANNSLLITASPDVLDQIKDLIAEFDVASGAPVGAQAFLIYKAKFLPAPDIELALKDLAADLEASGLKDPELFATLTTMKYVAASNSLIFTGTQESIDKLQGLIDSIDNSSALGAIQRVGNVTFLVYKIQSAAPDKLINALKGFAFDLKKSDIHDKKLAECIDNVRWIKETNSLLFTGSEETLQRVEDLIKKFDTTALQGPAPIERAASTFVIYNPKYVAGDELILILCEFMQNLINSGVADPGLYDTISNLRWIDKTSSLLISGDQASVHKTQELLAKFDLPNKETTVPSIESIDNTSFLVYKLQYHPGNDIQVALKQMAASVSKSSTGSTTLAEAINSVQWIQVTNSLLCTGAQDVLVKLKELIQNIDVPLRQVFIELLLIETNVQNIQNFGLAWGAQSQYFNKATMAIGNFPNTSGLQSGVSTTPNFISTMQGINASTTPAGGVNNQQVPFINGFDLGAIGDIIMHKGRSFLSLGSLVNALQQDNDTVIVLNPKIITQDNRQSIIFVGQNVPYTGAIVTTVGQGQQNTANIEYRDVGMSITITPVLGEGDVVTMDIVQDLSEVINGGSTSTTQLNGITTNHTHMETRVQCPDNYFVALSGMINDSKLRFSSGIPCLGGLPVIGALFSENDREITKNNIIIFIRPKIINTYEDYKNVTEHQEWLYKDQSRLPILKEWFDEGIDMVKVPANE